MSDRRNPGWRDRAATELLLRSLPGIQPEDPILVMGDSLGHLCRVLESEGREAARWNRRTVGELGGTPWPPPGPFRTVLVRLPRVREELAMTLHAGASVLEGGGRAVVYGATDEGARTAKGSLAELFQSVGTVSVGRRCRVLTGTLRGHLETTAGTLGDWKKYMALHHPLLPATWISYPGVFSHGRLDEGTRLLIEVLPTLPPGSRALDYGCGSGVVAHVARRRGKGVEMHLSDVDSIALEAAMENVPEGQVHLTEGLPSEGWGPFDAILSNPPFHRGKEEDPGLVMSMVEDSVAVLNAGGSLVFVTQRRLPVEGPLRRNFRQVRVLGDRGAFRVWCGKGPKKA